jgi:AAA15 family ATPase/GTPase
MKIQLQSLRVINCGPLRDVCIHFATDADSPVTVLAGANGSGKTTVLELIIALSDLLNPQHDSASSVSRNENYVLNRAEYAQMDWLLDDEEFSIFCGKRPADFQFPLNYYGRDSFKRRYLQSEKTNKEYIKGQMVTEIKARIEQQGKTILNFADSERQAMLLPSILYFPHSRFLLPLQGKHVQREEINYCWTYSYQTAQSFEGSLDSYLIWLDYAEPETFSQVAEFLSQYLDGKKISILRKDLKAVITTGDGGTHYLENLSSGEQNILIMLLELRRRLLPHSIVLIDEIENSLHQAFQKKLAQALKRMQEQVPFQLIVTTHSIPIVETFGSASTRILTEF